MSQEKPVPAPTSNDATPPRAGDPNKTLGPSDLTLHRLPTIPPAVALPGPGDTDADLGHDATLAQPAGPAATLARDAAATLPPTASLEPSVPSQPTDVTLDPNDPRVRAYHEAAHKTMPGQAVATGASFGDYELIEPIAKGGMGIVYKGRQRKLNRIVAIKMILAGQFADQADVDRFYAEAEAAASLSHPNIVAIHEIGEVQGQHFFSMDFIEGKSLAGLVQENPLPPRRACELVRVIAETMQYAHDSGIVHRDLKPSNVLLDKKQRPLITDFGLAKHVTSQSQLTMAGAVVGTPSYMPPEQAAGKGDQVGPWSDLYSLGAILYEMLTGRPPFRAATPFETIRQVLETEPLSPRLVNPGVPRDLETICLKCLQKERVRRYTSAQELADELGRFLRGEPIQARPISQVARFWRLCKRNPVMSSVIAAAVLILVAATAISTSFYVQTAAALVAKSEALKERSAALALSERDKKKAMAAVNDLLTEVSENTLFNRPGMQPVRKNLLQKALTYYQGFLQERGNDATVQDELADGYYRVGVITEVLESPDEALPKYNTARKMQVELLAQRPTDPTRLEALGTTLNALGTVWIKKKDYAAAHRDYGEAIEIRTRLAAVDPAKSEYQRVLANTYMNVGSAEQYAALAATDDAEFERQLAEARRQFEEAQRIRQTALQSAASDLKLRRDLGKGSFNLGNLERDAKSDARAVEHFRAAVAIFEQLAAEQPSDLDNQKLLAMCYRYLADTLSDDQPDERRKLYQAALGRLQPLAQQNPDVVEYQTEQAGLLMNLFQLESQIGNSAAARAALERAKAILQPLAMRFPAVPRYQYDLAKTLRELAIAQDSAGEKTEAASNLGEAVRIFAALAEQYSQEAEYAEQLEKTKAVMLTSGPRR